MAIQLVIEESLVCFVRSLQTNRTHYLQARSFSFEVQRLTKENVSRLLANSWTPTLYFKFGRSGDQWVTISSPVIELFASSRQPNFDKTWSGNNQIKRFCIKVHMTWKIFSAYLKGLLKYRRKAFFFLTYLFSF